MDCLRTYFTHVQTWCVQSATEWSASVHTSHMSKPNIARVLSATAWTASVHTSYMSKRNVARVRSATAWTASVHTLHIGTWSFEGPGSRPSKLEGTFEGALRRYLPRVAAFQATFEGSGPLKVPLKVPSTFDGSGPLKVPWKVPFEGPFEGTFEGPFEGTFQGLQLWRSKPFDLQHLPPPPAPSRGPSLKAWRVQTFEGTFVKGSSWDYPAALA